MTNKGKATGCRQCALRFLLYLSSIPALRSLRFGGSAWGSSINGGFEMGLPCFINLKYDIVKKGEIMVQMAVNVDENVKHDIEKLYNSLGMNINTAVNIFFQQCLIEQGLPFQQKTAQKHIPLKERLKDYSGNYKSEEWDTGEPVGRELL